APLLPPMPPPPPEMEVASTDRPQMESSPMDMPKLDIPVNIGGGNALGAYSTGGGGGGMGGNNGAIPMATFEPMMPRKAALAGLASGKVLVEFTVTERGTVSNIRIVKEEPRSYDLGKAARQTIAKWTFKPAMVDGKPQASRMQQEIEFATN
ncbi:energy transducer TonB, partial [Aeromonas caviae]|uniref:energy transducer TonB n=1 Tax=Aeromonas caviae TaxID=648 RepID=UPI001FB8A6CA